MSFRGAARLTAGQVISVSGFPDPPPGQEYFITPVGTTAWEIRLRPSPAADERCVQEQADMLVRETT